MPEASPESIAATLAAAATAWGRPVELVDDLSFSNRATVLRIAADDRTAVAKRPVDERAHNVELAALERLPSGTRPELLAHSDDVIVMSDLGDGPSLADLLLGDDARLAEAALLAWARTLGRIAAATGDATPNDAVAVSAPDRARLEELCVAVGHRAPEVPWSEIEAARARLLADTRHHGFVPSDACPDNTRCIGDTVVLFDFEFSGWMHVGTPAAYCVVPFPSCWCLARLPDGLVDRAFVAFSDEYAPAATDGFGANVARAGVLQLLDLVPAFARWFDTDARPGPFARAPSTNQQRTTQRLDWIAAQHAVMPATAEFAAALGVAYRDRRPSPDLPLYPAFRGPDHAAGAATRI